MGTVENSYNVGTFLRKAALSIGSQARQDAQSMLHLSIMLRKPSGNASLLR